MKLVRFMKSSTDSPLAKARAAAGGQHVVRPGDIIADRFGRMAAEEHAARMADLGEQRFGIVDRELDMFGGKAVGQGRRLGQQVVDHDDHAVLVPAVARGHAGGRAWRHCTSTRSSTCAAKSASSVIRIDWLDGIVLGLAEQVGGDPVGIVLAVGDDQDFARPGDHVDADHAVELALGFGDPGIAGAGDDIDRLRSARVP